MDQEEFRNKLSQIAVWGPDREHPIVVDRVLVPLRSCQYCHMRDSLGRASIYASVDGVTNQKVWRIYCNTCSRHLDPNTRQPVSVTHDRTLDKKTKRPRGRPRKETNP